MINPDGLTDNCGADRKQIEGMAVGKCEKREKRDRGRRPRTPAKGNDSLWNPVFCCYFPQFNKPSFPKQLF